MRKITALKRLLKIIAKRITETTLKKISIEKELDSLHINLENVKQDLLSENEAFSLCLKNAIFYNYSSFYKENKKKQELIKEQIESCDNKLQLLINDLFQLYSEEKKYKYILEKEMKQMLEKEMKKEAQVLDEVNTINFINNKNS